MQRKLVLAFCLLFAMAFAASPAIGDTIAGLGTITASGNAGTIQSITYSGTTYNTDDLLLGSTLIYNSSDVSQGNSPGYPDPGADDFGFDQTVSTTDGSNTVYIQTIFGTTNSYDTFFVFENNGNDDASWYGVRANGSLTTGIWVDASATAVSTPYTTGIGPQTLKGFVFTTSEDVAGIRILPGNSLGVANDSIGFDAYSISTVPIPGAVWLLGSGLIGLVAIRRKLKK